MKMKDFIKNNLGAVNAQTYSEVESLLMPKPLPQSSSKNADHYNKMREISEKYGKLPLKPGFTRANVRLQHLSIDVSGSDYVTSHLTSAMPTLTSGNTSNRNAGGGIRTV